jgi:hypothetical protein
MTGGIIYGKDESELSNTATNSNSSALYKTTNAGTAKVNEADQATTDATLKVNN